jgi:hypothetical protein
VKRATQDAGPTRSQRQAHAEQPAERERQQQQCEREGLRSLHISLRCVSPSALAKRLGELVALHYKADL